MPADAEAGFSRPRGIGSACDGLRAADGHQRQASLSLSLILIVYILQSDTETFLRTAQRHQINLVTRRLPAPL